MIKRIRTDWGDIYRTFLDKVQELGAPDVTDPMRDVLRADVQAAIDRGMVDSPVTRRTHDGHGWPGIGGSEQGRTGSPDQS